jgi:hypothetical protein
MIDPNTTLANSLLLCGGAKHFTRKATTKIRKAIPLSLVATLSTWT